MGNDFRIKKINAKEEVEFHNTVKEINAIKTQLVVTVTIRNLSWPKSKEKILTSLLTATTMKMKTNSKNCKPSP